LYLEVCTSRGEKKREKIRFGDGRARRTKTDGSGVTRDIFECAKARARTETAAERRKKRKTV